VRQSEHDNHVMGSPEQRREPAASTSSALPPPHVPTTFDGHVYSHLPANLTNMMNAISSGPAASTSSALPPPISFGPAPQQQHEHTSLLAPSPVRLFI
jgi:hypothetical protein